MADKPCRWLYRDSATAVCEHPLLMFHDQEGMEIDGAKMYGGDSVSGCHGCPCHEPQASVVKESLTAQPDPTPDTCRWTQDEFKNWFSECSGVMPTVTPWDGRAIHGMFCPECGKRITTQVHDKP